MEGKKNGKEERGGRKMIPKDPMSVKIQAEVLRLILLVIQDGQRSLVQLGVELSLCKK
jgi:hypothetical protein